MHEAIIERDGLSENTTSNCCAAEGWDKHMNLEGVKRANPEESE